MRRRFILSSALVAALSVAWSATPVSAGAIAHPQTSTAISQPSLNHPAARTHAHTLHAAAVPAGTSPSLLQGQFGVDELSALAAPGSTNHAVSTPADPSIAVGPSNVVEAVNSAVQVTTRSGTSPIFMDINAMINNTSTWDVRYPHVVYDPASGRFILAVLQFDPVLTHCGAQVAIMESQSNPALAWISRGTINIDPEFGGGREFSNLSLGLTATLLVVSSDYESCTTGLPVASQTTIIQRADLISGALTGNSYSFFAGGPIGLQPAMAVSAQLAYEVANDANCSAVSAGFIAVIAITGTPDARNVGFNCTFESDTATSMPPAASQNGISATLTTGTDRFQSAFWQSNLLWVAGNTGCTPSGDSQVRSCLNVESIPASSTGTVGAPTQFPAEGVNGSYLFDPALALDSAGDAVLTFDESSSSSFESVIVAAITGGAWSSLTALHASTNFYDPSACSSCAWGDYSAAVQDATHPTDVWVMSENTDGDTGTGCANANSCWDTYVGRYTFAGPTISSLSPSAGPASGGQLVTVSGSDFTVGTTVFTFNGATVTPTVGSLTPDSLTFTTPSTTSSGLVQAQVTDSLGTSPVVVGSGYIYVGLANYVSLSPFRILDTRPGSSCIQCTADPTLGPNTTRTLQLTGVVGLPSGPDPIPTDATAVVLNVTEVAGTANSVLIVYPFGTGRPQASNLNFAPAKVIPNLVTVTMGKSGGVGAVSIYNAAGSVNVLADVEGYFEPQPSTDVTGEFHPISPVRVCDTRSTSLTPFCKAHGALGSGATMIVNVTGVGPNPIPSNGMAAAAVVNLTGIAGSALTYLSLFPTNSSGKCVATGTSTLNLTPGVVEANRVMVDLGPSTLGGSNTSLCVFNAAGIINVVIDANGWFGSGSAPTGAQYQGIQPTRICDTRFPATSCPEHSIGSKGVDLVTVAGHNGIPSAGGPNPPVAIIANLTAIAPTQATYLVMYAANIPTPGNSDINVTTGEVLPNLVVVQLDPMAGADQGDIDVYNAAGAVNIVIDIEGWFQ